MSQVDHVRGIEFIYEHYLNIERYIPKNSLIYCDPPYENTKQYGISKNFNHVEFWDWVRGVSLRHTVFVSEYSAPEEFEYVWDKDINSALKNNSGIKGAKVTEKLFKIKNK